MRMSMCQCHSPKGGAALTSTTVHGIIFYHLFFLDFGVELLPVRLISADELRGLGVCYHEISVSAGPPALFPHCPKYPLQQSRGRSLIPGRALDPHRTGDILSR